MTHDEVRKGEMEDQIKILLNQNKMLSEALRSIGAAAQITGKDYEPTGPELLVLAEDVVRLFKDLKGERPKELASLVLCKSELFYQTKDGKTIKTEYPVTKEQADKLAKTLNVQWSEQ